MPVKLEASFRLGGAKAWINYLPKGVVGIVAPWNFPVQLTFSPLAAALAAGNRVMVKLPEATPRTSDLIAQLISDRFDSAELAAITGDASVAAGFSRLAFDHLLFTGNPTVGRAVMRAAADNLTPVTLELGGKSPVVILPDANLMKTARSIMTGKLLNAGQICLAPDHVFVPESMTEELVAALESAAAEMLGPHPRSGGLSSIISERHADRQRALIENARAGGAKVIPLAEGDGSPVVPPTILIGVNSRMQIMQEEIFGPLLPLVPYRDLRQVIEDINSAPRPLALYIYGSDREMTESLLSETLSGGVTINDILLHASSEMLPLGGIGESGMGSYRGHWGFQTFSHARPVYRAGWLDAGKVLRPPYGKLAELAARHLIGRK